jgi:hypothetical protein
MKTDKNFKMPKEVKRVLSSNSFASTKQKNVFKKMMISAHLNYAKNKDLPVFDEEKKSSKKTAAAV